MTKYGVKLFGGDMEMASSQLNNLWKMLDDLAENDPEAYKEYISKVKPIVEKFGGEYLVRAGEYKVIDGEWKYPRTVVIKFPTYEKALEWYNSEEYKPVKPIRLENTVTNGIIIRGVENEKGG